MRCACDCNHFAGHLKVPSRSVRILVEKLGAPSSRTWRRLSCNSSVPLELTYGEPFHPDLPIADAAGETLSAANASFSNHRFPSVLHEVLVHSWLL
jgi:hypothetical protein